MDYLLGAAPTAARRLSGAIGRTTEVCVAASTSTLQLAPAFLAPTCAAMTRGIGGGAMAVELCHTLLVNSVLAEHDGYIGVELQPSRASTRIWTSIFAGLARMIWTGASAEFSEHYRSVLAHAREWVFAYTSRDLEGAVAALTALNARVGAMRQVAPQAEFARNLIDVLGVWVSFVLCLSRAAAEEGDKSAAHVDAWLRELAARSLSEYEMHGVCWVLQGIRHKLDEPWLTEILAMFAPHGIEAGGFDRHVAAACIAISDLAG
jgi:hypothetical protein